jgi:hypothetical protein
MGGACGGYGGDEKCVQNLIGEPEDQRPLGRHRRMWVDNIKMYNKIFSGYQPLQLVKT